MKKKHKEQEMFTPHFLEIITRVEQLFRVLLLQRYNMLRERGEDWQDFYFDINCAESIPRNKFVWCCGVWTGVIPVKTVHHIIMYKGVVLSEKYGGLWKSFL